MKEIKLTKGRVAIVDDDQFENLNFYHWILGHVSGSGKPFAFAEIEGSRVAMHRVITMCPKNQRVKHINGNTLDNRRENLVIIKSGNSKIPLKD